MNYEEMTFEQLAQLKSGTILEDGYENGIRYLIVRGPAALCVYVGVPLDHPLANKNYNDLPMNVHGGLTYGEEEEDGGFRPPGMYWYRWDYGHAGDVSFYDLKYGSGHLGDKAWTLKDVKSEIRSATWDFSKLKSLVESIKN